jgi:DNA polymerase
MLRPAIIPAEGNVLVVADWSAIEGRVHPWLSNCPSGEDKLDAFRKGLDPYIVNAAATFNKPYAVIADEYENAGKSDERQVGKVQELALGFLGGAGSFETFGRVYGVRLSDSEIQKAIKTWRRANMWAMKHGQDLESAYTRAMRNKGHEFSAGRVTYLFDGQHLWYVLPSGRILCYPFAVLDEDGVAYAKASWKPAADAKEWPKGRLWRGLACENVTQAVANDVLRYALRCLDQEGYTAVAHVHDEVVVECPADKADEVKQRMIEIMCEPPAWASGLPLDVEIKVMTRYGK